MLQINLNFMHKLFKLHTFYDPMSHPSHSGWGHDVQQVEATSDDEKRTLQKVTPAKLRLLMLKKEMKRQKIHFSHVALREVTEIPYFQEVVLRNDLTPEEEFRAHQPVYSNEKFMWAILLLISWGVMVTHLMEGEVKVDLRKNHLIAHCKYFMVPKALEFWRSISDARRAGALSTAPPPVNLPHLQAMLIEIALLGATHSIAADFAFFFFQISCHQLLARMFVILCGTTVAMMTVVPMGYSRSPRWAQCIAWAIVLMRKNGEPDLGVKEKVWGPDPPPFIRLKSDSGETVGLIVIWIDNVLVLCKDPSLRDLWATRLKRNASENEKEGGCHAIWKEFIVSDTPNYIGIHFQTTDTGVIWCHEKARTEKWKAALQNPVKTPRDVARLVGIIIWHCMVMLTPLYVVHGCIEVMRRVATKILTKSAWDKDLSD